MIMGVHTAYKYCSWSTLRAANLSYRSAVLWEAAGSHGMKADGQNTLSALFEKHVFLDKLTFLLSSTAIC